MEDKELLAMAAKAADICALAIYGDADGKLYLSSGAEWNPLTDDEDALRLAVKLEMQINFVEESDCFWIEVSLPAHSNYQIENDCRVFDSLARKNVYACTRRAIVLAAAEIGQAMQ